MKLIPCSQGDFDAFVASYPRPLVRDVLRTVEPERIQYNDFTLGNWPDSVIASFSAWGCDPNDPYAATPGDWRIGAEESASPTQAQLCERLREWLGGVHLLKSRLASRRRTEMFFPGSLAPELLQRSEEMLQETIEQVRAAADTIESQAKQIAELEAKVAAVEKTTIERCAKEFDDLDHPIAATEIQKTIRALLKTDGKKD